MTKSDAEIQQELLQDANEGKPLTLVTEAGDLELELTRVSRTTKQAALRSLPDAMLKQMDEKSDEDEDTDFDISDLENLDDLSESNPDEFDPDAVMPPETVEQFYELIEESLQSNTLADVEIRGLFEEAVPDDMFYAICFIIIAYSGEMDGVKRFRTE